MLLIFDQRNLKRTKYNTAITYKSSPSFLYILYSVHTFYQFSHTLFIDFFSVCFVFLLKGKKKGVFGLARSRPMDSLCQGVHKGLLVATRQQLLFLICAGQGVATVVCSHVQSGIHWVSEVGGLQREKNIPLDISLIIVCLCSRNVHNQ